MSCQEVVERWVGNSIHFCAFVGYHSHHHNLLSSLVPLGLLIQSHLHLLLIHLCLMHILNRLFQNHHGLYSCLILIDHQHHLWVLHGTHQKKHPWKLLLFHLS